MREPQDKFILFALSIFQQCNKTMLAKSDCDALLKKSNLFSRGRKEKSIMSIISRLLYSIY